MIFPHRVLRRLEEESTSGIKVNGVGFGVGVPFDVQLSPTSSDAVFKSHGVELDRAYFLCWEGVAEDFPVGCLLEDQSGRFWLVATPGMKHDFGNAADHCDAVAQLLKYEPANVERSPDDASAFEGAGWVPLSGSVAQQTGGPA